MKFSCIIETRLKIVPTQQQQTRLTATGQPGWASIRSVKNRHHPLSPEQFYHNCIRFGQNL